MPVFSSHLGKYDDLKLGQRVREERQTQKLTLGDVAQRTGLSIAKLSQMETGALVLDFETLVRIAGALGVETDTLLDQGHLHGRFRHRRNTLVSDASQMRPPAMGSPGSTATRTLRASGSLPGFESLVCNGRRDSRILRTCRLMCTAAARRIPNPFGLLAVWPPPAPRR